MNELDELAAWLKAKYSQAKEIGELKRLQWQKKEGTDWIEPFGESQEQQGRMAMINDTLNWIVSKLKGDSDAEQRRQSEDR